MKFNIQSTLFASLVLLVGTAAAAPVAGDDTGDLNVGHIPYQRVSELMFRSRREHSVQSPMPTAILPRPTTLSPLSPQRLLDPTFSRDIVGHTAFCVY